MADEDLATDWGDITRHDVAIATVREFAQRSGAVRVVALLDDQGGVVLEADPEGNVILSQGEDSYLVPPEATAGVPALALQPMRPVPATAIDVDPERGEVMAPMGALASLALGVLELARVLGGRSVATADFAIRSGEPLTIAAREGEPLVMALGEQQFAMPEGWPGGEPDLP